MLPAEVGNGGVVNRIFTDSSGQCFVRVGATLP